MMITCNIEYMKHGLAGVLQPFLVHVYRCF